MKLKDYATSKKDMKKGVEIVPEENYRLRNEDKYTADNMNFGTKGGKNTAALTAESKLHDTQFPEEYEEGSGFRE